MPDYPIPSYDPNEAPSPAGGGRPLGNPSHHNRRPRHRKRPCGNPPSVPTGVTYHFTAHEAKTHLNFTGLVSWDEVTQDIQGHPTRIKRYDVQIVACDSNGRPVQHDDLVAERRRLAA